MDLIFKTAEKVQEFDAIWKMWWDIIRQKGYYPYDETYDRAYIEKAWFHPPAHCVVAKTDQGEIVGAYIIRPNQPGYGNHIANAAYMVSTEKRGNGIGKQLGAHSLKEAKRLGYEAMQFNLVVSTNISAVKAWQSVGFEIIGTIPEAYRHDGFGKVDAHIMYRKL